MGHRRRRRQVAWEAARLMCHHEEPEFHRARWKAALRIFGANPPPGQLPPEHEVHAEIVRREASLRRDAFGLPPEQTGRGPDANQPPADRFRHYETLLLPLEQVHEDRRKHPEGDVLYHSLQVFELARQMLPYDEEFLLAALLHDVGKAIDPKDHIAAGLEALAGTITPRTAWFIEHHGEALLLHEGRLGVRSRRRLEADESFDELLLLAACDRKGRVKGMQTADVVDALDYISALAKADEG